MSWIDLLEKFLGSRLSRREMEALEKRNTWRVKRRIALFGHRNNGQSLDLVAVDFAFGGLRIESPRRLRQGEILRVRVARPFEDVRSMAVPVRVMWSRRVRYLPQFLSGLAFVMDTPERRENVAWFLLHDCRLGLESPVERRKGRRGQSVRMKAVFSTEGGPMIPADVVDLALGGILLRTKDPVEPSTAIRLKIVLGEDLPVLNCTGVVVRAVARRHSSSYDLGVMFKDVSDGHNDLLISVLAGRLLEGAASDRSMTLPCMDESERRADDGSDDGG